MFSVLALVVSFLLWKVFTGVVLFFMFGIFFILGLMSWAIPDYDSERTERNSLIIWGCVALFISIPYWDWMCNGSVTMDARNKFMQGWGAYTYQVDIEEKASVKPVRIEVGTELRRYELVGWNPPKHFYVNLEDVQTHQVYNNIYVSKHCNNAYALKKGDEYNILISKYTMSDQPGKVLMEFNSLYGVFCQ
jgi:hypothetical protein